MDDDFEVDLEAVDVVFFAFAVVSLDFTWFNAVASDSILAATAPVAPVLVTRGVYKLTILIPVLLHLKK